MKVKLFNQTFEIRGSWFSTYYFEPEDLSYKVIVDMSCKTDVTLRFLLKNKGIYTLEHIEHLNLKTINLRRKNTLNLTKYLEDQSQLIEFSLKNNLNLINSNYGIML